MLDRIKWLPRDERVRCVGLNKLTESVDHSLMQAYRVVAQPQLKHVADVAASDVQRIFVAGERRSCLSF